MGFIYECNLFSEGYDTVFIVTKSKNKEGKMALLSYKSAGQYSTTLEAGTYRVVVIGPGGDGAKGGTSSANNYRPATRDDGAAGGGGGGGAYVFVNTYENVSGNLEIEISGDATRLSGAINVEVPQAGSGSPNGGVGNVPGVPGASVDGTNYVGSRGGGAGGNAGTRISSGTMPSASPIPGGQGSNGDGESSTVGTLRGTVRSGGTGGKGGDNIDGAGIGGRGASVNGLSITESNILTLSANDIAHYISGGNGSNGTAPASRPSMTGVAGGKGGGGGGAWTSGQNGANPTSPGRGINGQGGAGGAGGTGAVWLLKLEQLRKAQEKVR